MSGHHKAEHLCTGSMVLWREAILWRGQKASRSKSYWQSVSAMTFKFQPPVLLLPCQKSWRLYMWVLWSEQNVLCICAYFCYLYRRLKGAFGSWGWVAVVGLVFFLLSLPWCFPNEVWIWFFQRLSFRKVQDNLYRENCQITPCCRKEQDQSMLLAKPWWDTGNECLEYETFCGFSHQTSLALLAWVTARWPCLFKNYQRCGACKGDNMEFNDRKEALSVLVLGAISSPGQSAHAQCARYRKPFPFSCCFALHFLCWSSEEWDYSKKKVVCFSKNTNDLIQLKEKLIFA